MFFFTFLTSTIFLFSSFHFNDGTKVHRRPFYDDDLKENVREWIPSSTISLWLLCLLPCKLQHLQAPFFAIAPISHYSWCRSDGHGFRRIWWTKKIDRNTNPKTPPELVSALLLVQQALVGYFFTNQFRTYLAFIIFSQKYLHIFFSSISIK